MIHAIQLINQNVVLYLNSFAQYDSISSLVRVFADGPIFFLPIFFLWFWLYYAYKKNSNKKTWLLFIVYSILVWIISNMVIQSLVYVQRPLVFLWTKAHLILAHIPDASFPSDHATVSFAFLAGLYLFWYKKISYCFLPFVLLMLLSRIAAGIHRPSDILAWMGIGMLSAYSVFLLKDRKIIQKINTWILKIMAWIKL